MIGKKRKVPFWITLGILVGIIFYLNIEELFVHEEHHCSECEKHSTMENEAHTKGNSMGSTKPSSTSS